MSRAAAHPSPIPLLLRPHPSPVSSVPVYHIPTALRLLWPRQSPSSCKTSLVTVKSRATAPVSAKTHPLRSTRKLNRGTRLQIPTCLYHQLRSTRPAPASILSTIPNSAKLHPVSPPWLPNIPQGKTLCLLRHASPNHPASLPPTALPLCTKPKLPMNVNPRRHPANLLMHPLIPIPKHPLPIQVGHTYLLRLQELPIDLLHLTRLLLMRILLHHELHLHRLLPRRDDQILSALRMIRTLQLRRNHGVPTCRNIVLEKHFQWKKKCPAF